MNIHKKKEYCAFNINLIVHLKLMNCMKKNKQKKKKTVIVVPLHAKLRSVVV